MTYPHCSECGCDLLEMQEREAEMCTECQERNSLPLNELSKMKLSAVKRFSTPECYFGGGLFNPDVPRPAGEIDVRGEYDG